MAAKPTLANAEWSTTATISGSPVVGQNGLTTKDDPGLATRQAGGIPGKGIRARTLNWLLNQLYLWAVYLNDLHNSSAFLTQNYAWTGDHTFDRNYTYDSAQAFTVLTPLSAGYAFNNFVLDSNNVWTTAAAAATDKVVFNPQIPANATVTDVRAGVFRGAGGAGNMTLKAFKVDVDTSATPSSTQTQIGSTASTSGTSAHAELLAVSGLSEAMSPSLKYLKVELTASASTASDSVYWVQVFFTVTSVRPN